MKNTKRKFLLMQIYDHTGIKKRLERMAEDGWKLEKIGGMGGYKFRRIEPRKLEYSIVYFPEASEFDPEPRAELREFIELCEQSGWEYIDSTGQMLVFCAKEPNPIPIETDALLQVETAHKAMKKSFLPGQYALLALAILQLLLFGYRIVTEPVNVLLQDALLVSLVCYVLIFVMCVYHIGSYFLWHRKALTAASDGIFVETTSSAWIDISALVILVIVFTFWLLSMVGDLHSMYIVAYTYLVTGIYCAVVFGVKALMKKLKFDRDTNKLVTFGAVFIGTIVMIIVLPSVVMNADLPEPKNEISNGVVDTYYYNGRKHYVYDDPIPLTLSELGIEADYEKRSRVHDVTRSALITVYNGQEIAPWGAETGLPELYYTLTIPRMKMLMDVCAKDILDDRRVRSLYGEYKEVDSSPWQATQVFLRTVEENEGVHYTVIWSDRIMEILLPAPPTDAQIQTIAERLKTYKP